MCTVTYIPPRLGKSFILTSNRDEKEYRPTTPPALYHHGTIDLVYPKDNKAGGSWIAMNSKGVVNCLLNGGLIPHLKQDYHTVSRGKILIELTSSELSAIDFFNSKDLYYVEPFTLVSVEKVTGGNNTLTEFIWDGTDKYFREMDVYEHHIWSSVTLYNEEQRRLRRDWFENFRKEHPEGLNVEKILGFHSGNQSDDNSINLIMQREGGLKTVSITQISLVNGRLSMTYSDLLNDFVTEVKG